MLTAKSSPFASLKDFKGTVKTTCFSKYFVSSGLPSTGKFGSALTIGFDVSIVPVIVKFAFSGRVIFVGNGPPVGCSVE